MRNETKIVLSALEGREKYDAACKRTWMLREIIAPVLQYTIKEYQTHTVSDVIRYINADSISDEVPVDDLPAFIEGVETEMSSPTEKGYFSIFILQQRTLIYPQKMFWLCYILISKYRMSMNHLTQVTR